MLLFYNKYENGIFKNNINKYSNYKNYRTNRIDIILNFTKCIKCNIFRLYIIRKFYIDFGINENVSDLR